MSSLGKTSAALLLIKRTTYSATSTLLPNAGAGGSGGAEAAGAALPHAGVGVAKEIEKSIASGALQRRQQQQQQQQQREFKQKEPTLPIR